MSMQPSSRYHFDVPATYKICVQGSIATSWSDRLEGMVISVKESTNKPPVTTLRGELRDQAALAGVLNTLYNMHLPVLFVKRISDSSE
ncbi:MAG: hypothetical protein HC804_07405 [Anaerolineae bacterium]|nr:hypothetical protein [Anaerolineae bacterium]